MCYCSNQNIIYGRNYNKIKNKIKLTISTFCFHGILCIKQDLFHITKKNKSINVQTNNNKIGVLCSS